jgi:hypothetical protein
MKRGSVVGPMILIGLGALFLVRNIVPDFPVWDLVSRYWPVILIAWGALRLLEVLFLAATSQPLPRAGISGGEWFVVMLVCLIGGSAYTAHRYSGWFPNQRALRGLVVNMGESFDYPMAQTEKTCSRNCRVVLENFRGNAKIVGSEINVVKLSGRKSIRAFQQNEADKANTDTPVELIVQGDQMIVRTNQSRVSDSLLVSTDLELRVPFNTSVEAHGRTGDFDIEDIRGSAEVSTDNGGVRLEKIGGSVRVDTRRSDIVRATGVKGSVDLKGRGQDIELTDIDGPVTVNGTYLGQIQLRNLMQPVRYEDPQVTLNLEKLPGQVHMGLGEFNGENLVGPVRLSAHSRDIHLTNFTQSLELNLERGDIQLSPGKTVPKMDVKIAHSGDIELGMPEGAKFDLKASTERGEAHNDYGSALTSSEWRHGATLAGVSGAGPQVRLETPRGTLTIRKGEIEEGETPAVPEAPKAPKLAKPPVKIDDQ